MAGWPTCLGRWPAGDAGRRRWPGGGRIPADGPQLGKAPQMARLVDLSRQMARSWARRCRWPGGEPISADGRLLGRTPQMAGWQTYLGRWSAVGQGAADGQAGEPIPADGRLLGKTLQMARLVSLSPQIAPLERRPRAGLDGAPPQTPQTGPQPHLPSRMARWVQLDRFQPAKLRPRRGDYRPRTKPSRCLPAGVDAALACAEARDSRPRENPMLTRDACCRARSLRPNASR
jgi:hypothetical protein